MTKLVPKSPLAPASFQPFPGLMDVYFAVVDSLHLRCESKQSIPSLNDIWTVFTNPRTSKCSIAHFLHAFIFDLWPVSPETTQGHPPNPPGQGQGQGEGLVENPANRCVGKPASLDHRPFTKGVKRRIFSISLPDPGVDRPRGIHEGKGLKDLPPPPEERPWNNGNRQNSKT